MEYLTIQVPAISFPVESREVAIVIDVRKIPQDLLTQVVFHGIKQKVADAASNAATNVFRADSGKPKDYKPLRSELNEFCERHKEAVQQETLALMQKAVDALYAGKWQVREGSGTSTKWTEAQTIALEFAKADLLATIKKIAAAKAVKPTMKNFLSLGDKVAPYFVESKAGIVSWNDETVMDYIKRQLASGKADYMTRADEELARRAALVADSDFDELFSDL